MPKFSGVDILIIAFGLAALAVFLGFIIIAEKRMREQRKEVIEKLGKHFDKIPKDDSDVF